MFKLKIYPIAKKIDQASIKINTFNSKKKERALRFYQQRQDVSVLPSKNRLIRIESSILNILNIIQIDSKDKSCYSNINRNIQGNLLQFTRRDTKHEMHTVKRAFVYTGELRTKIPFRRSSGEIFEIFIGPLEDALSRKRPANTFSGEFTVQYQTFMCSEAVLQRRLYRVGIETP